MEDLDPPREAPGAAERIVSTLSAFGFEWDGTILHQSTRAGAYGAALAELRRRGLLFECSCSRATLARSARYPGFCRERPRQRGVATASRLRVEPGEICFIDRIQGEQRVDVGRDQGDLILRRRDGLHAYLLAVVLDDADQGVTDIVRGADLLEHTAGQIYLQRALGLPSPRYAHVPALTEPSGAKLAKSMRSVALNVAQAPAALVRVLALLGLEPPAELAHGSLRSLWTWAVDAWNPAVLPRRLTLRVPED